MKTIEQKELQTRWQCSESTVRRYLRRFGAKPVAYRGRLIYALPDIEVIEGLRAKDAQSRHELMRQKLRAVAQRRAL